MKVGPLMFLKPSNKAITPELFLEMLENQYTTKFKLSKHQERK